MQIATSQPSSVTLPALIASISGKSQSAEQTLTTSSTIILFGRDDRGRPHGSRFDRRDKAEVERAAQLMDFHLVEATTKEMRDIGAALPEGRIFPASGKAFVPFVKAALFDRLIAATGAPDTPWVTSAPTKAAEGGTLPGGGQGRGAGGGGAGDPPAKAQGPADWSKINIGDFVLAQGDYGDDGYFAAKVISIGTDNRFGCVWANYPDLARFMRPRNALALLHPEAAAALA